MTTGDDDKHSGAGVRFCRNCSQYLPIHLFPKGPTRYLCKQHWMEQVCACNKRHRLQHKESKNNNNASSSETKLKQKMQSILGQRPNCAASTLQQCKRDLRLVFKKDPVHFLQITEEEIIEISRLQQEKHNVHSKLCIIPLNPSLPWSLENSVICKKAEERDIALSFWRMRPCLASYKKLIQILCS